MPEENSPTNPTEADSPTRARLWMGPFLASLSLKANVTTAAKAAGISRTYAYQVRAEDAEFALAWENAMAEGVECLEAEAWRRAYDGCDRPVYQGGILVGTVREYSDTLMQTLLKAHAPQKYRERQSVEMTGKDGGPIEYAGMNLEQVNAKLAELERSRTASQKTETPTPSA